MQSVEEDEDAVAAVMTADVVSRKDAAKKIAVDVMYLPLLREQMRNGDEMNAEQDEIWELFVRSQQQFCWGRFRTIDGDGLHPYYLFLTLHTQETICTHAYSREYYEVLCCCRKLFVVKNAWGFFLFALSWKFLLLLDS